MDELTRTEAEERERSSELAKPQASARLESDQNIHDETARRGAAERRTEKRDQSRIEPPPLNLRSATDDHESRLDRDGMQDRRRRRDLARPRLRAFSPLTRRILAVNLVALLIPIGGLLYLGEYRRSLIKAELTSLRTEGEIISAALGVGAVAQVGENDEQLMPETARLLVHRIVLATDTRARLFLGDGSMMMDSRSFDGPRDEVEVQSLFNADGDIMSDFDPFFRIYDQVFEWLPPRTEREPYIEQPMQLATDYYEVGSALVGEALSAVRHRDDGALVLSVAVPVQRYKQVLAALMISTDDADIREALSNVRSNILRISAIALAITVLMSFYLAGTIARPVWTLAAAAHRVRKGQAERGGQLDPNWPQMIPDMAARGDEIGDLSAALRAMAESLSDRMGAIERFAADVSHELKNPLSSLRSAVETLSKIEDPDRRKRLMTIVLDDVQRLDRLITDISSASRLDAELSRMSLEPVDLREVLELLVEVEETNEHGPDVTLSIAGDSADADGRIMVNGMRDRLVQVIHNLLSNAKSFSPEGGTVRFSLTSRKTTVILTCDDDGPGIPDGKLNTIFERFYTERPQGEKFGTHSGLGLSISRQIIGSHGGTLRAENRRDGNGYTVGARFILTLPRA
ncbi:MAG: stimulus-sensing domain-containing protein [Pseudomonadota bacterium]